MKAIKSKWYLLVLPFFLLNIANSSAVGFSNCLGGQVSLEGNITSLVQCIQNDNPVLFLTNNSTTSEAEYFYVLTNNVGNIITYFTADDGIDLDANGIGTYRIYGFSYTGNLNESTLQSGLPYTGISSDACYSYSSNFITVVRNSCEAVNCQGGNIFTNEGDTYISVCADGVPDVYTFTTTSTGNANYTFVLTDANGLIIEVTNDNSFDFEGLAIEHYAVRGISYHGQLVESTTQPGQLADNIQADGFCIDQSVYYIGIDVVECTLSEGCTHLYFSEYIEGSNNNRALEIYNPTPFPVNLADYDVFVFTDGAMDEQPIMALSGTLQPGDVYVITHSQAATELLSQSDITGGVATFTGNDAIALLYNLEPIDIIGVIGENAGMNGWVWQSGMDVYSTTNRTLVRKPSVTAGTTNWTLSRGQWYVNPENDFSNIGAHTSNGCIGAAYLGFETSAMLVQENAGTFQIAVNGYNITASLEATVSVLAGTAIADVDYVNSFPVILNFSPSETVQFIDIEILDDEEMENYEYFTLEITEESGTVSFVNQSIAITIEHSDQVYPDYTIAEVTTTDSFGVADSAEVICTLGGVVHGLNLNSAGTEFTLIENHSGIKVFDAESDHGYMVQEGDSVRVRGRVAQFYGMTFFYADSITFIDNGHELNAPITTIQLNEAHESAMVKIECVTLVNPLQWTNLTSGFDVDVTDGTNTFVMHIDLDTDLYGMNALDGHFNVIGIGDQHDETLPYTNGYRIRPRYFEDINGRVIASFIHEDEMLFNDNGAVVSFNNSSTGATNYTWQFGDGNNSNDENPTHIYPFSFFVGIADMTVTLTVSNDQGCSDSYAQTMDVVYSSVEEMQAASFVCYPNPTSEKLFVQGSDPMASIKIYDGMGRMICSQPNSGMRMLELETSHWTAGIYLLEVKFDQTTVFSKVIKH